VRGEAAVRAGRGAVPVQDFVAGKGTVLHKRCSTKRCKGVPTEVYAPDTPTGVSFKCDRCSAFWRTDIGFLLKNEVQCGRKGGPAIASRLSELATLERIIAKVPAVALRVWVLSVLRNMAPDEIAHLGRRRWPRAFRRKKRPRGGRPPEWSDRRVRELLACARHRVQSLIDAGEREGAFT
jgi:hypothetical protein